MAKGLVNGRYELLSPIAAGANAQVFRARDASQDGAERALKVIPRSADPAQLAWEFARLSALSHPHLPRVHDLDCVRSGPLPEGAVFLVEDLVRGQPCDEALAGDRTRPLVRLLAEAASALGYLHARGLLHRDVSPRNLLIDENGSARLIDLGLGAQQGAAGTPAYMAPEALAGVASARSDLYSLGATAWQVATGQPPHQGEGAELVRSILEREVPPPAGVDAELARIIARLCARDPAARHASAALLLSDLARLSDLELPVPEPPRGEAAAGVLVGRDAELGRLCAQLERLARGERAAPVVVVAGAPGSGRSRLCAEALRRLRLLGAAGRLPAVEVITRGQLAVTAPTEEARQVLLLEALAARAPAILHMPDASFAELRLAQRALGGLDGALLLVEHEQAVGGAENVVLAPLGETEVARLCEAEFGRPARPEFVRAVLSAAGGLPLGVHELCAAAWPEGDAADVKALGGAGLRERANRQLLALPAEARRLVIVLALADGPLLPAQALAIADAPPDALARLSEQGVVVADGNFIALATQAHVEAARAAADRPLIERVLAATTAPKARARLLAALGRTRDAAAAHLDAGLFARDALDLPAAADHLRAAAEGGETRARLPLAEVLVDRGEYTAALAELDRLPPSDPEVARTRARALQRGGDARAAEAALRAALGDHDDPAVRELLGRLLLARGAFAEARTLGAGLEIEGLAALYQGDHGRADECFRALFATAKDDLGRARALVLLGNAAHVASRFSDAAEHFAQALALAGRTGDVHTSAPAAGSLAAAKKELGDYAGALEPMRQAVRDLARLGQTSWYGAALGNLGSLLLALGDLTAAERVAARAREEATRRSTPLLAAIAALTEGDVLRRRGRPRDALAAYGSAEETFAKAGEATYKLAARRGRALALADLGRAGEASPIIADLPDDSDTQLVRARIALLNRDPAAAAIAAEKAAAALAAESRIGERWRADAVLARALARTKKFAPAREALARARKTFEEIRMKTPEIYRTSMAEDPDAQLFRDEAPRAAPDSRYRRLIALNKRLNSELRLSRLLELILDAVIEFTDAERGFLLLANKKGELAVELARNIDQRTLEASEFQVSRSIAERAAREGQPIVTIDAQGDERFAAALSVSDLRLRSVLAVPLRVKGRVVGTIYVDNRLRKSAFGDQDVALVLDFADQAAIAIDNARLLKELRRARTKAEDLATELATRVEKREAEIRDIRVELASSREALQVRYDYQNLIGRTPRMLDLFRLLDRVTETELPVVIYGESGTGKELAARAIHHNGRRRELPFVSENCAAIPETLLESTLFGYVRGAFTGADRDARGLFEIADGGTLFLDEVGEMSPAMQTKLLRVLQDGEFRRIGGERPRKVDVRIIAASNRRLQDLVKEGKFREDLFYRLNVVTVEMPPLRERCEDVPLLVDHFLRKQSETPKKVSAESMARLCGYAWPGNVRELENEIVRAAALAEGPINLSDLSPRIAAAGEEAPESPDDLRMKARVERLERSLLREALGRASGNQTRAARLLGLSRFGLQKKLKRYRIK